MDSDISAGSGLLDPLVQLAFAVMGVLTSIAADNDLSLTQLRTLAILRDRRLRMSELVEFLGLEKSTMSGLIDRAERRGLLDRVPHETDRRVVEVTLSAAGHRLARAIEADAMAALAPLVGRLRPAEQRQLQSLAERMLAG